MYRVKCKAFEPVVSHLSPCMCTIVQISKVRRHHSHHRMASTGKEGGQARLHIISNAIPVSARLPGQQRVVRILHNGEQHFERRVIHAHPGKLESVSKRHIAQTKKVGMEVDGGMRALHLLSTSPCMGQSCFRDDEKSTPILAIAH
jgi:hypothetical protein